jgi:hypothetical protein
VAKWSAIPKNDRSSRPGDADIRTTTNERREELNGVNLDSEHLLILMRSATEKLLAA